MNIFYNYFPTINLSDETVIGKSIIFNVFAPNTNSLLNEISVHCKYHYSVQGFGVLDRFYYYVMNL